MSDITITKTLESNGPISSECARDTVLENIRSRFTRFESPGNGAFRCRVRTRLLNPVVSLTGTVECKASGNRAVVLIDADVVPNGWFWFTAIAFVLSSFGLLLILLAWMYSSQKQSSVSALNDAIEHLTLDLWTKPAGQSRRERECPFCAERILARASRCRYCDKPVTPIAVSDDGAASRSQADPARGHGALGEGGGASCSAQAATEPALTEMEIALHSGDEQRSMGHRYRSWFLPGLLYGFAIWFGYDGWLNSNIKSVTFNRVMTPLWLGAAIYFTVRNRRDRKRTHEPQRSSPPSQPS